MSLSHYLFACIFCSLSSLFNILEANLDFCVFLSFFFKCSIVLQNYIAFLVFSCLQPVLCTLPDHLPHPRRSSKSPAFPYKSSSYSESCSCRCPLLLHHSSQKFPLMVILALEFPLEPVKPFGKGNPVSIHFSFSGSK